MMRLAVWLGFGLGIFGTIEASACLQDWRRIGRLELQAGAYSDGTCYLSLLPSKSDDLVYRAYLFSGEGQLMVFNSYGPGPIEQKTGAREFYFFPRGKIGRLQNPAPTQVEVVFGRHVFAFDTATTHPIWTTAGPVRVSPEILPTNEGGVEFPDHKGLMLDLGFAMGGSPRSEPLREIHFRDSQGRSCQVQMKEVFTTGDEDPRFQYTDPELKDFLANRCPTLEAGF